jgi:hypothetical protein
MQAVRLNSHIFGQIFKQSKFAAGIVITFQVMAVSGMSPGHPHAVRAVSECSQNELGAHPSGAGNSDHPNIGRILHPADPCEISRAVTAPVAQKSDDFRFPVWHWFSPSFSL